MLCGNEQIHQVIRAYFESAPIPQSGGDNMRNKMSFDWIVWKEENDGTHTADLKRFSNPTKPLFWRLTSEGIQDAATQNAVDWW